MPWSGKDFAERHNRKLTGVAAKAAAGQANALLKKGMNEGEAIAIANKTGDRVNKADRRYGKRGAHGRG